MAILCTLLNRPVDGEDTGFDVVVNFEVISFTPGFPATWTQPADPDEYEFRFLGAEFDGGEPDDAPGPLTESEIAGLKAWFENHYSEACEAASDEVREEERYGLGYPRRRHQLYTRRRPI